MVVLQCISFYSKSIVINDKYELYVLSVIAVLLCHTFYNALTSFCTGNSDRIYSTQHSDVLLF